MRIIVASSLIDLEYSGYSLSLMCLRCLEKVPNIFSQMVVNDGDESHATIRKKSPYTNLSCKWQVGKPFGRITFPPQIFRVPYPILYEIRVNVLFP